MSSTGTRLVRPVLVGVLGAVVGAAIGATVLAGPTSTAPSTVAPSAADIGFVQDMAVHHEQAVDMATLAGGQAGPKVRSLATAIQLSQARESGMMRGWLQLWGAPQLPSGPAMSWMEHGASDSHAMTGHGPAARANPMPGMASRKELDRLSSATGTEFDILFLQLMIRHHQGGVLMAEQAGSVLTVPAVLDFAHSVIAAQTDEIVAMTTALQRAGARPLPPPVPEG